MLASMFYAGIIAIASWRAVYCQSALPEARLVVEEDVGFWVIGNETNEISALADFNRVPGPTENSEFALEVKPGTSAILHRSSEGECIANIEWCQDGRITFTFWVKVLEWRASGAQTIIRTGNINTETAFVVITTVDNPLTVFFNGAGKDFSYDINRELVEEWTFFAAVIDVNITSMKVFLNGTQMPDSGLEISDNVRNSRARFTILGSSSQVPDYYFSSFKVFYATLSQEELENMYSAVVNGSGSNSNNTQNQTTTAMPKTATIVTNVRNTTAIMSTTTSATPTITTASTATSKTTTAEVTTTTTTPTTAISTSITPVTTSTTTTPTTAISTSTTPTTMSGMTTTRARTTSPTASLATVSVMTTTTLTTASSTSTTPATATMKTTLAMETTTPATASTTKGPGMATAIITSTTSITPATTRTTTTSGMPAITSTTTSTASATSATASTTKTTTSTLGTATTSKTPMSRTTTTTTQESSKSSRPATFMNGITITIIAAIGLIANGSLG